MRRALTTAALAGLLACGGSSEDAPSAAGEPTPEATRDAAGEPTEATPTAVAEQATAGAGLPPDPRTLSPEEKAALLADDPLALKRMMREYRVAERLAKMPPELSDPDWQPPAWDFSAVKQPELAATAPTPTLQEMADPATDTRCVEKTRHHLVVERDGARIRDGLASVELKGDGSIEVARGRHRGQRGLPLAALVGDAEVLELVPCRGDVREFSGDSLRSDAGRWVLVLGGRDIVKLIDLGGSDEEASRPAAKNLAVIRLR